MYKYNFFFENVFIYTVPIPTIYGELVENTKIFEITTFKELCNLTQKLRENERPQDFNPEGCNKKEGATV